MIATGRSPGVRGPGRWCAPSWESWAAAYGPEGWSLCSGFHSGEENGAGEEEEKEAKEEKDGEEEDAVKW